MVMGGEDTEGRNETGRREMPTPSLKRKQEQREVRSGVKLKLKVQVQVQQSYLKGKRRRTKKGAGTGTVPFLASYRVVDLLVTQSLVTQKLFLAISALILASGRATVEEHSQQPGSGRKNDLELACRSQRQLQAMLSFRSHLDEQSPWPPRAVMTRVRGRERGGCGDGSSGEPEAA